MNMARHSEEQSDRLMSIDALRGFDMFWIVGGHGLVMSALALLVDPLPDWLFSGHILRLNKPPATRVGALFAAGSGCLLVGWLWSFHFPINKHIWSSSMALWASGWSFLLLGLFYLLIDVWGCRRWAFPFVVIGMNAITAYMAWHLISFHHISNRLLGGLAGHLGEHGKPCLLAAGPFVVLWLILFHMYRSRKFLRV